MKCLRKYKWVKLLRSHLPTGKGLLGYWAKIASRAAFRKGNAVYCGHINPVTPGMWSGGVVGRKSILGVKKRTHALWIMSQLQELGYLTYTLDQKTKHLTYQITDWVVKCSGAECMDGAVYATDGYGFLCMPREIPERLVGKREFEEADAWLDLWCHTTYGDYSNAFSFLAPAIQYGKFGSVLTLEGLGKRWGWEKTKVWRFFKKHADTFALYRLPGAFGCVMLSVLQNRNADCEGISPGKKDSEALIKRVFMDRYTVENKHHQDVPSRNRFEAILSLIPQKSIQSAVDYLYREVLGLPGALFQKQKSLCSGRV